MSMLTSLHRRNTISLINGSSSHVLRIFDYVDCDFILHSANTIKFLLERLHWMKLLFASTQKPASFSSHHVCLYVTQHFSPENERKFYLLQILSIGHIDGALGINHGFAVIKQWFEFLNLALT